ncbi:MAG TPA: DUF2721 domain-containing protein [Lysobacter sp.]
MSQTAVFAHYAILTAMLAPAFFLTATASLLMSANTRLARVIDRTRVLLAELADADDEAERALLERRIARQRLRSITILRGGQLLYGAISCFVGTSLTVAADAFLGYRFGALPTALAALGVLAMFAASLLLARESSLAVEAVNEEMDHAHARARQRVADRTG